MRPWILLTAIIGGVALGATALLVVAGTGGTRAAPANAAAASVPAAAVPSGRPSATSDTTGTIPRTITVSGHGVVKGRPDVVTINLGVLTHAGTANGALTQANDKATALIATLKGAGVQADDITTTEVSVSPQYDQYGQHITGYSASNQVLAKLRDLSKAGAVIDAAAGSAGDAITLGGIAFSIDDTGALKQQARTAAVMAAKAQADDLAAAAGAKVGKVLTINEANTVTPVPFAYPAAAGAATDRTAVPLQPGTQQVSLDVTVVYELTD